ncbi:MAG: cytidine deaminase [Bacilli bacterium]|nr:cytidine deaminase [Bacilli bacterium]
MEEVKLEKEIKDLYDNALKGYKNAYAPYSKFQVGAALLLNNGEIIYGSNVENASYGLTNCAERSTLFATYSKGYRKNDIKAFMIIGNTDDVISPCGACRQVMSELMMPNTPVYLANLKGKVVKYLNKELLPYTFTEDNLNEGI